MTIAARVTLRTLGLAVLAGVLAGTAANGNPFGAATYVLAALGLTLWTAMTLSLRGRAEP